MPLDPNTEMKSPEKKEWPVMPEDVYQVEVTDLTAEESEYKGEKKDVFKFEFTIIDDGPYYGRKLWKKGSRVSPIPYSNGKNPLTWKVCSAVAKHSLTEEEGKAYTIEMMNALIGKQLRVGVTVTPPKEGKQYNNADGFYSAKTDLPKFDESKVNHDAVPPSNGLPIPLPDDWVQGGRRALTPAEIVAQASGGKFGATLASHDDIEIGENDVEDIPW